MPTTRKLSIKKIRKHLENNLDETRFEHTLGVAKTAQLLACLYGIDTDKAYIAGLLHDCAKNHSTKTKLKLCEKNNVSVTSFELENPSLLHSKVGAIVAKEDYMIDDEDILNAIRSHTTGRPGMSLLEKIVFIADYIEPGRPDRPGLEQARMLAFTSINASLKAILKDTLAYLSESDKVIDPMTQATFDYYKDEE